MTEREFKKLLIDLDLTIADIARAVGISNWAVTRYFRGELRAPERRRQIKRYLAERAQSEGIELPDFWNNATA